MQNDFVNPAEQEQKDRNAIRMDDPISVPVPQAAEAGAAQDGRTCTPFRCWDCLFFRFLPVELLPAKQQRKGSARSGKDEEEERRGSAGQR